MSPLPEIHALCRRLENAVEESSWEEIETVDGVINQEINDLMQAVSSGRVSSESAEKLVNDVSMVYKRLQSKLEVLREGYAQQLKMLNNQRTAANKYLDGAN